MANPYICQSLLGLNKETGYSQEFFLNANTEPLLSFSHHRKQWKEMPQEVPTSEVCKTESFCLFCS